MLSESLNAEDLGRALDGDEGVAAFLVPTEQFAAKLAQRQDGEWFVTRWVTLAETDWIGTELAWPDDSEETVVIGVRIRAWTPSLLRVPSNRLWCIEAYVETPCECNRDHGNHPVDLRSFEGGDVSAFERAGDDVLRQVDQWMTQGTSAETWRQWAGLPGRAR